MTTLAVPGRVLLPSVKLRTCMNLVTGRPHWLVRRLPAEHRRDHGQLSDHGKYEQRSEHKQYPRYQDPDEDEVERQLPEGIPGPAVPVAKRPDCHCQSEEGQRYLPEALHSKVELDVFNSLRVSRQPSPALIGVDRIDRRDLYQVVHGEKENENAHENEYRPGVVQRSGQTSVRAVPTDVVYEGASVPIS